MEEGVRILVIHMAYLGKRDAGGSRYNRFARLWADRGHQVTVLTQAVHHLTGEIWPEYRGKWVVREEDGPGVTVLRCFVTKGYNRSLLGRLCGYLAYAVSSAWAGLFSGPQDVVIASSPPLTVALTGYMLALLKRCPMVFEVRDLWPDSAVDNGSLTNPFLIWLASRLERFAYRRARLVVAVTPGIRERLLAKGVPEEKIALVTNAADLETFTPGERDNWVRREYGLGDAFVVMYSGGHGVSHNLELLIRAAALLRDDDRFRFLLVGDGLDKPRLVRLAEELGLSNVVFVDAQPKSRMPDFCNAADAGCAVLKKAETFKTAYPGKVFDYMACARPVIVAIDGIIKKMVEEDARCGIQVDPEDPAAFAEAVRRLAAEPEECRRMGERGRRYVEEHFDRRKIAERFEGILAGLARRRG